MQQTLLVNTLKKCFQENLHNVFPHSSRPKHKVVRESNEEHEQLSYDHTCRYSEDELYGRPLEWQPKLQFKRKDILVPKEDDGFVLPLIPMIESKRIMDTPTEATTKRKNQRDRGRTFSNRVRSIKSGVLQLDPDHPLILRLFRNLGAAGLNKMDLFLEVSKQQLINYLMPTFQSSGFILRLLTHFNFPPQISYFSFKSLIGQMNELSHLELLRAVFIAFDCSGKGLLKTKDIFDMFKAAAPISSDADYIFRSCAKAPQEVQEVEVSPLRRKRQKRQLFTQLAELDLTEPKKNTMITGYKEKDMIIVSFERFKVLFKDRLPESLRMFIKVITFQEIN